MRFWLLFILAVTSVSTATASRVPTGGRIGGPSTLAFNLENANRLFRSDLKSLSQLKFKDVSPAHLKNFQSSDGRGLAKFILERVDKVALYIETNLDSDTRIYAQMRAKLKQMEIGQAYFESDQIDRWSTLLHEAKHGEGNHDHVNCLPTAGLIIDEKRFNAKDGPYKNLSGGCDALDDGAYAVEYVFFMSIAESCTNCSRSMRRHAAVYALGSYLPRIIDPIASNRLFHEATKNPEFWIGKIPKILADLDKEYEDDDEPETAPASTTIAQAK